MTGLRITEVSLTPIAVFACLEATRNIADMIYRSCISSLGAQSAIAMSVGNVPDECIFSCRLEVCVFAILLVRKLSPHCVGVENDNLYTPISIIF